MPQDLGPGRYDPPLAASVRAAQKHHPGSACFAAPTAAGEAARKRRQDLLAQAATGCGPGSYNAKLPQDYKKGTGHVSMGTGGRPEGHDTRPMLISQWCAHHVDHLPSFAYLYTFNTLEQCCSQAQR